MKCSALLILQIFLILIIYEEYLFVSSKQIIQLPVHKPQNKIKQISKIIDSDSYFGIKENIKIPLYGDISSISEYYVSLSLGTPPQTFLVQFDTGSADLAIPMNNCPNCGSHPDSSYTPSSSNTSQALGCITTQVSCRNCFSGQCGYTIQYLDNSGFSAYLYSDVCIVEGVQFNQIFGGIYTEKNGEVPFEPVEVDGIIGMAYKYCSQVNAPTMIDVLVSDGVVDDIFSICSNTIGGVVTIGGIGDYYTGEINYTPIIEEYYYKVFVTDILIAGKSIGINPYIYNSGGAVVDSGTTDIILPELAYDALEDAFTKLCEKSNLVGICDTSAKYNFFAGYCFSLTQKDIEVFPTIDVVMSGGIICSIKPENYLVKGYCSNSSLYALALDKGKTSYGLILGDAFMKNFEIVFDRQNQRIGFAAVSNCS